MGASTYGLTSAGNNMPESFLPGAARTTFTVGIESSSVSDFNAARLRQRGINPAAKPVATMTTAKSIQRPSRGGGAGGSGRGMGDGDGVFTGAGLLRVSMAFILIPSKGSSLQGHLRWKIRPFWGPFDASN